MAMSIEEKKYKQFLNLRRWRDNNRDRYNRVQLAHSARFQKWVNISKSWLRRFPPDLFD